jgi:tRNA/tmRNA/rRNA uracil-C5-methylase (TrmA/RlmC/RlmD family)
MDKREMEYSSAQGLAFADLLDLKTAASQARRPVLLKGTCHSWSGEMCRICHASRLSYEDECAIKRDALREFFESRLPDVPIRGMVPSPKGREYRTVSKRKAFSSRQGTRLCLIDVDRDGNARPFDAMQCAIEPVAHAELFAFIGEHLRGLNQILRHVVIKGNYDEYAVIFTVTAIDRDSMRAINGISKSLTRNFPRVTAVFVYEDSADGRYYFGTKHPDAAPVFRKVYGKPLLFHRTAGKAFLYHPLAFSQINLSILDHMVDGAAGLLGLDGEGSLYDLYSGYGLFSICLAKNAARIIGAELSQMSHQSAIENARRNGVANPRFYRCDILPETIGRIMRGSGPRDAVLLDPPRNGTAPGVIAAIAAQRPARVVHVFCNIDLIPVELAQWRREGYEIEAVQTFDAFPGTAVVETMVALRPA